VKRSVTQLLKRQRQKDHRFKASLGKVSKSLSQKQKDGGQSWNGSKKKALGSICNTREEPTGLNVRAGITKLVEENISDLGLGKDFLTSTH
jgi:hypothetical protein